MADHDLPAGDLRRHARGDARRRARLPHGRGHRDLRRRLQGDRRLHRRVRRQARDGHAAGRVGDHRLRDRRRRGGPAPDRRDAVLRLRLLRLRPARQRRRQDVLPDGPVGEHHRPAPERRRLLRRPVPLAEPRGVVHARAGPEDRRAEHRRGREGPADQRRARPQPGALHGAQAPLPPREGRRAHRHLRDAVHGADRARGHRPDGDRLRRDGPHGAGGDRGPGRLDRGAGPALARPARRGGDPQESSARRARS